MPAPMSRPSHPSGMWTPSSNPVTASPSGPHLPNSRSVGIASRSLDPFALPERKPRRLDVFDRAQGSLDAVSQSSKEWEARRQVGVGGEDPLVIDADRFDHRSEQEIERAVSGDREVIFARASPEAKLQIAEAL